MHRNSKRWAALFMLASAIPALSQTSINLATQSKNPDFSNFPFTRPLTVASSLPATCQLGQILFNSAAQPGANLYVCGQANVWANIGNLNIQDSSGNIIGAQPVLQFLSGTNNYITWALVDGAGEVTVQPVLDTSQVAILNAPQTWAAGQKNSFSASATSAPLNFSGATLPGAPTAGDFSFDTTNTPNWFDGAAWRKAVYAASPLAAGAPVIGTGANGLTTAATTGSGNTFVLSSNPVLNNPVIGSFINALHGHTNAADGGQLTTAAFSANVLTGSGAQLATAAGSWTSGDCLSVGSAKDVTDAGVSCGPSTNQNVRTIRLSFDNEGGVVTSRSSCETIDFAGTIQAVTLLADQPGNATVDIRTVPYAAYSGLASASSITASATPAISSAAKYQDAQLSGWKAALSANTVVCFVLTNPASITHLDVDLKVLAN
jgi:hypothetical protein